MTLHRALVALAILAHSACAAQHGTREDFAAGRGDVDEQLRAAQQELQSGDADDAAEALEPLGGARLDARQQLRYQLLLAEVAIAEEQPLRALQLLPPAGQVRDGALAAEAERLRAQALFRIGDAVAATQALVLRERLLTDSAARAENRELLWQSLQQTGLDTAVGPRLAQVDRITRGWVSLAVLARSVWIDPQDLARGLEEWRAANPQHPAEERLGTIQMPQLAGRRQSRAVALLLPLSGPHAASAEAVRDGFFAAHYAASGARPVLRIYDSGATPDTLLRSWHEALDEGAEFVVGPLTREGAAQLAARGRPAVPVLALNYLESGQGGPTDFYQWGLAPEDEARQAAERAVSDRQFRAVALVPAGEWGDRVLRAFTARLEELGGRVVQSGTYVTASRDHSESIRTLLALDASNERHRSLTATLGVKTEFEPRRRGDVDLVFVAARPDHAKLIGPQLRFHRTGSLPIYATALIYDGDAPDPDLAGLRFCDMPWMVSDSGPWAPLRGQLRALFPQRPKEYTRLLALGHDAYALVGLIDSGQMRSGSFFPAPSGTLTLRDGGVISRGLSCVEIRGNALKPLDVTLPRADAR